MLSHNEPNLNAAVEEIRTALRPTLVCLWTAWAIVLFGGFLLGPLNQSQTNSIPSWCRMTSSLLLVTTAWTWFAALLGSRQSGLKTARTISFLVTLGIGLGTIGDFFNANLLQQLIPLPDPTLGGLISFLIGHIAYITAFVIAARKCNLTDGRAWLVGIGLWQSAAIIGWYLVVYRGTGEPILTWAALPYSMVLAGTAGVTTALAMQRKSLFWLALGAALFLFSDLVLGYRLFQGSFYRAGDLVWLTYGPGQMLIVFATGAILALLPVESEAE